jgi:hypothetical protein
MAVTWFADEILLCPARGKRALSRYGRLIRVDLWKKVANLALAITVVAGVGAGAVRWNEWQVDRDFHKTWIMLSQARDQAIQARPVTVRFARSRDLSPCSAVKSYNG